MENNTKEVMYKDYCPKCIYADLEEVKDPCNECLNQGYNENSHKPIKFKEDLKMSALIKNIENLKKGNA